MRNLLASSRLEILELRRQNELLRAQMAVVDVFAAACGLRRDEGRAMAIDIAWELQNKIDELEAAGKQNVGLEV